MEENRELSVVSNEEQENLVEKETGLDETGIKIGIAAAAGVAVGVGAKKLWNFIKSKKEEKAAKQTMLSEIQEISVEELEKNGIKIVK